MARPVGTQKKKSPKKSGTTSQKPSQKPKQPYLRLPSPESLWQLLVEQTRKELDLSRRALADKAQIPSSRLNAWVLHVNGRPARSSYSKTVNSRLAKALKLPPTNLMSAWEDSLIVQVDETLSEDSLSPWQSLVQQKRIEHDISLRRLETLLGVPYSSIHTWLKTPEGHPPRDRYTEAFNSKLAKALQISPDDLKKAWDLSAMKFGSTDFAAPDIQKVKETIEGISNSPIKSYTKAQVLDLLQSCLKED